jgi:hypothetical protein
MTRILTDVFNLEGIPLTIANPTDAFGYLRTTQPQTMLDIRTYLPTKGEFLSDAEVSGTGTSISYNANGYFDLSVNTAIGKRVARSTIAIDYQNGKAPILIFTGNFLTDEVNVSKRVGLAYGSNYLFLSNSNGSIRLEFGSPTIGNTTVLRSSWDDPLDGTGLSGINLDLSRNFIFFITFQYLGVGGLFCGFRQGLKDYIAHQFNKENTNTLPYWTTPNLFPQYEIEKNATGGNPSSFRGICATAISNGQTDSREIPLFLTNNNSISLGTAGSLRPLIYFRLNPNNINSNVSIVDALASATATNAYQLSIIRNPVSSFVPTWTSYTNSSLQYQLITQADYNATTLTIANLIDVKFQVADARLINDRNLNEVLQLTSRANGTPDVYCLAIRTFSNGLTHVTSHLKFNEEV